MLFKNANQVTPCGLFSIGHLLLFTITMISIVIALKLTKNIKQEKVKEIIRKSTIILWILEIIKIIFNIKNYGVREVNKYVPLYFCSLILYAGIFTWVLQRNFKKSGRCVPFNRWNSGRNDIYNITTNIVNYISGNTFYKFA